MESSAQYRDHLPSHPFISDQHRRGKYKTEHWTFRQIHLLDQFVERPSVGLMDAYLTGQGERLHAVSVRLGHFPDCGDGLSTACRVKG
ncbi:hypothetical protein D3C80_708510 [compost metagenome]